MNQWRRDERPCTPASGWEKGQLENQVGTVRQNFFAPRVRVKSLRELNDWLADRCVEWAKARPHPEIDGKTIWEVFEAERASLLPYRGPFDGFHAIPAFANVSRTIGVPLAHCRRPASCGSTVTRIRI